VLPYLPFLFAKWGSRRSGYIELFQALGDSDRRLRVERAEDINHQGDVGADGGARRTSRPMLAGTA
jgi:hypothetical protein